jgi:hypothetical protein
MLLHPYTLPFSSCIGIVQVHIRHVGPRLPLIKRNGLSTTTPGSILDVNPRTRIDMRIRVYRARLHCTFRLWLRWITILLVALLLALRSVYLLRYSSWYPNNPTAYSASR